MWAICLLASLCLIGQSQGSSYITGTTPFNFGGFTGDGVWCEDGYEKNSDIPMCIKVVDEKMSWEDANNYCEEDYGQLVQIYNEEENDFVKGLLKRRKRYWIGIRSDEGTFSYIDGAPLGDYHPWAARQPNNYRQNEECVEMIGNRKGSWNDKRCRRKRPFICQGPVAMAKK